MPYVSCSNNKNYWLHHHDTIFFMFIAANDGTNSDIGFSPITNRHCETEESCTLGDDYYGML